MNTTWTRSTACMGGACVEAACADERILVRDTAGTIIELPPDVWDAFVLGVQAGEFDVDTLAKAAR